MLPAFGPSTNCGKYSTDCAEQIPAINKTKTIAHKLLFSDFIDIVLSSLLVWQGAVIYFAGCKINGCLDCSERQLGRARHARHVVPDPDLGRWHEPLFTVDDPKTYKKPWNATVHFDLMPDTELIEDICENEKDAVHIDRGQLK
jgi:hypothetical protein